MDEHLQALMLAWVAAGVSVGSAVASRRVRGTLRRERVLFARAMDRVIRRNVRLLVRSDDDDRPGLAG